MPTYLATHRGSDGKQVETLVEAGDRRGALGHIARKTIAVRKATNADLFRVAKAGGEIEVANSEAEIQEMLTPDAEPEEVQEQRQDPPADTGTTKK